MNPWKTIGYQSKSDLQKFQSAKLHQYINQYLYPFSPQYRDLFDKNKIDPRKIKTIEDLKHIPFSSKSDLKDGKYKDFILQPDKQKIQEFWPLPKKLELLKHKLLKGEESLTDRMAREFRPVFMTFTTGTTSTPVPFVYTNYDIDSLHLSGARMLKLFQVKQEDRIVNIFPFAPHLAFWQVVFGGLASNNLTLSTGGGKTMGTEGNLKILATVKPALILGVPSYVYHVLRQAKERNMNLDFLQKIVLGASRVTKEFKMKLAEIAESMGAKNVTVFGTYGFTEARCAWAESPTALSESSGYHLYPDQEIFEIVDPDTGEVKKEGQDGELVYTSLNSRGSSVLRYRTGDFVKGGIVWGKCASSGLSVPRLSSDITRLSDVKDLQLSKVKGALVNLNTFATVLSEIKQIDEWQLEIRKRNNDPFDVDELIVYICPQSGCSKEDLTQNIQKQMMLATELTPNDIVFVSMEEIVKRLGIETENKEKRILDSRPKD